eukprot:5908359-Pyramimonas_sp.AAC.1
MFWAILLRCRAIPPPRWGGRGGWEDLVRGGGATDPSLPQALAAGTTFCLEGQKRKDSVLQVNAS